MAQPRSVSLYGPRMRVVGGSARGRRLVAPPGDTTRPTIDRVREAVINALWSRGLVEGARVLDLFAGSGAMGVEALSRGAAHATFVDDDAQARKAVTANLRATGLADQAEVVADRAERFLARYAGPPYDLAFCDPPYVFDRWDELLAALPAPFVVTETPSALRLPAGWDEVRATRYGRTWVTFAQRGNLSRERGGE
jgi:16S rRNA (guanine966-N2)-methyltransferase